MLFKLLYLNSNFTPTLGYLNSVLSVSRAGQVDILVEQETFNPLGPKSDQRQISLCNITALLNRVVMRIKDMITQDESN